MGEFDERAVVAGMIRGGLTLFAAIIGIFGVVVGFVSKTIGTVMIITGIAVLAWSIASSWKDTSPLKWVNIVVKIILILFISAGLVSLYVSPYV
ncbi:MAG: hypothetical protein ACMXYM_04005 [Candidatus Woesearchaeota archaeon]